MAKKMSKAKKERDRISRVRRALLAAGIVVDSATAKKIMLHRHTTIHGPSGNLRAEQQVLLNSDRRRLVRRAVVAYLEHTAAAKRAVATCKGNHTIVGTLGWRTNLPATWPRLEEGDLKDMVRALQAVADDPHNDVSPIFHEIAVGCAYMASPELEPQ